MLKALETPFVTQEMAAHYAGVNKRTLQTWIAQGEADSFNNIDSDKAIFYHSLKKAQIIPAIDAVSGIKMAGDEGQWQALAWLLERLWPKMFGRNALELQKMDEMDVKIAGLQNAIKLKMNPQQAQMTQDTNDVSDED